MFRFLHLADLHLDANLPQLGDVADIRKQDLFNAFVRAVDYALETTNNIHAVVIAGDFFNGPDPSKETLLSTINQLRRLKQAHIPVVLTPGNHDALGYPRSVYGDPDSEIRELIHLVTAPNVEHVFSLELNGEKAHFYSMAWHFRLSHPPYDDFVADDENGFHIAVIHGTVKNGLYAEVQDKSVPLDLAELAKTNMDYIALGHLHAHRVYKAGHIPVVYPGTLEGMHLDPGGAGQRYLTVITLERDRQPQIEQLPWNVRTLETVEMDLGAIAVDSDEELVEYIRRELADNNKLLRLTLTGITSFVPDQRLIQDCLKDDFFWFELRDRTAIFDNIQIDTWAKEETVRGFFIRKLRERIETAPDGEQHTIEMALKLGIRAFEESM